MGPPPTAEGNAPHNAHQRQVGRHAGVFEDALLEHILEVGGIRHEKRTVEDGPVLLGIAVDQIAVSVEGVDGAGVLHQRKARRDQQHTPHGTAQQGLPCQHRKTAGPHLVAAARQHTQKVQDKKDRLACKEKVIVDQVERYPEWKTSPFAVQHGIIQGRQHIGKEGNHIEKMVEKDVVDGEPGKGIQTPGHHAPVLVPHPAAGPEIPAPAGQGDFQAEQRHHHPGHEPGRHPKTQPKKGAAQKIKGIGIDKPAAQVGGPAEGAPLFDKGVGVLVKVDLLVVEVPCIMEESTAKNGIRNAVGQKQGHRQQKTKSEYPRIAWFLCGK